MGYKIPFIPKLLTAAGGNPKKWPFGVSHLSQFSPFRSLQRIFLDALEVLEKHHKSQA